MLAFSVGHWAEDVLFDTTIIVGPLKFTVRIILRHYTLPIEAPCDFCLEIDPLALPIAVKSGLSGWDLDN